jgi:hypothetical protein
MSQFDLLNTLYDNNKYNNHIALRRCNTIRSNLWMIHVLLLERAQMMIDVVTIDCDCFLSTIVQLIEELFVALGISNSRTIKSSQSQTICFCCYFHEYIYLFELISWSNTFCQKSWSTMHNQRNGLHWNSIE